MHHTHAAPAAAARGLDDHRVADGACNLDNLLRVGGQCAFRPRHTGHARLDHGLFGRDLVAHDADRLRRRPDEDKTAALDALGKIGVLAQEAVTGVDRLGVGDFSGRDDRRHVQVAQRRRRRADAHRLVGQLDVLGVAVGLGIDHHRLDAHLAAGALDAQGDLAAVGDQDFFEHAGQEFGRTLPERARATQGFAKRTPRIRLRRSAGVPCRPHGRETRPFLGPSKPTQVGLEPRDSAPLRGGGVAASGVVDISLAGR